MTNKAYVLMTALPPTKGHLDLIRFAAALGPTTVIVNTQPDEPYWAERVTAIRAACSKLLADVSVQHIHKTLPQEPEGYEGFWDMWGDFLRMFGFQPGDYICASELYGIRLAEEVDGIFMPYDLNRSIRYTKGTRVRKDPVTYWNDIIPEFRKYLQKTVTIFGAESCGKTTMASELVRPSVLSNSLWTPEWARPYLETVGSEVTDEKMHAIMRGQFAMEEAVRDDSDVEFVIRDTDLFSTIGYWEMYDPENVPSELYSRALIHKADLYLVMASDIPFEADILRYGGDKRESSDQYWIDLLNRYDLPFDYIQGTVPVLRRDRAYRAIRKAFPLDFLAYQRVGAEYA